MHPLYLDLCTQLIYSVQSHLLEHQASTSSTTGPVPSLPDFHGSPPPEDTLGQVCQSVVQKCSSVTYFWQMECLPPPLTTIPAGMWKCPSCTPCASSSGLHQVARLPCETSASPPPSLTLTLIQHRLAIERGKKWTPQSFSNNESTSYNNSILKEIKKKISFPS